MQLFRIQNSFILTIFGASGDLAKLKIFPALYSLIEQKRLPKDFYIVGFARTSKSQQEFKKEFIESIKKKYQDIDAKLLSEIISKVYYFEGQYDEIESYKKYLDYLKKITNSKNLKHIAYLSVPPQAFKAIVENLGETKNSKNENLDIVIEKPFGEDLKSARELSHFLARYFDEEHIYLLDHYLGKSAVQSILHLRHSNRILNQIMKGTEVANIQITAFEDIGVENRIGYFDQVGTIKDMFQSHLLQLIALITMSIPITEAASSIHREKNSILSALSFPRQGTNLVLGQYASYKKEPEVPKNSKTETFVALRLFIDRESWYKVPIYIRTGKKLHEKHTYVAIEFRKFAFQSKNEEPNLLILELAPEEKINIKLLNKNDYGASNYSSITTSESIACSGDNCLPEHSILLLDIIRGRKNNFLSFQQIIASWSITETILDFIRKNKIQVEIYKDQSPGPSKQDKLTAMDGFKWHDLH